MQKKENKVFTAKLNPAGASGLGAPYDIEVQLGPTTPAPPMLNPGVVVTVTGEFFKIDMNCVMTFHGKQVHDEEALSEMEQLIATLEAHQRSENYLKIKAVVPELDRRYRYGRDLMTKQPESLRPERGYRYMHRPEDIQKAMLAVLARVDNKLPPPVSAFQGIVGREPYPVADKAAEVLRRLLTGGVTRFLTLFRGSRSRSEVVATFLAVLELCKARRLRLAGAQEDCTVTCTQEGEVPLDLTADREPS